MSLEEYNEKRNFEKSPEPKGEIENKQGSIFVIQEHDASHLHWDLRLEIGGTLKSWAVPKEPPVEKGLKRLAIQVEDHPIEYANFEGVIPEGNYGAGTVSIWDRGEFVLKEKGEHKLTIELKGKKMHGIFALIKVPNLGKNSWLFFRTM
jgi:DNA ligase D-like protein (predicted 3'-phosphoesterase)